MINAKFKCHTCGKQWGSISKAKELWKAREFIRKASICIKCDRFAEITLTEASK